MQIMIETAEVGECAATDCVYNIEGDCRARAITVGDGTHPMCDTFFTTGSHCTPSERNAAVGACKVSACRHNRNYECQADRIRLGSHQGHADCLTFSSR